MENTDTVVVASTSRARQNARARAIRAEVRAQEARDLARIDEMLAEMRIKDAELSEKIKALRARIG